MLKVLATYLGCGGALSALLHRPSVSLSKSKIFVAFLTVPVTTCNTF